MKEYPVKLMNLTDLIKFEQNIRSKKISGRIIQKNFEANIHNALSIAFALPLDSATVIENN